MWFKLLRQKNDNFKVVWFFSCTQNLIMTHGFEVFNFNYSATMFHNEDKKLKFTLKYHTPVRT